MKETITRTTHQIDATGKPLGRLATEIAVLLRGKHKVTFVPYLDEGDAVEVINADKFILTGKKVEQKVYRHHSGYPGGLKTQKIKEIMGKDPGDIIRRAVYGMLPKNSLRDLMMKRLRTK